MKSEHFKIASYIVFFIGYVPLIGYGKGHGQLIETSLLFDSVTLILGIVLRFIAYKLDERGM